MKRKPKGKKYRNLYAEGSRIYYERLIDGRRVRFSTRTDDWDLAASVRDLYEQKKRVGELPFGQKEMPRFGDFAERYLNEATGYLAATTREDRKYILKPGGRVLSALGSLYLDAIRRSTLLEWWNGEIEGRGSAYKTGKNHLDAISAVLGYAVDLEIIEANPADDFRATLRRRNRTQQGRSSSDPALNAHPIEDPADLQAFLEASGVQGGNGHLADLLQLDAGLRLGEAGGLRWCDIGWGKNASDTTRSLVIESTRARGRHTGKTKSGRSRRVAMSRRLRKVLMERWLEAGQPKDETLVLDLDQSNYRNRHFAEVCKRAGLGHRRPKDLRDTFASQLVSSGVPLPYVSQQLGHADVSVTARHYARWAGGDAYRRPLEVLEGEVPADLLARIPEPDLTQKPDTSVRYTS